MTLSADRLSIAVAVTVALMMFVAGCTWGLAIAAVLDRAAQVEAAAP